MMDDNKVPQLISSAKGSHDIIRCIIIMWAQRNFYDAYSEPDYDKFKPDLVLCQRRAPPAKFVKNAKFVYVEIQKDQKDSWIEQTIWHYRGKTLSIFQPKDFDLRKPFGRIKKKIEQQIAMDVVAPVKRKVGDPYWEMYIMVGTHRVKRKNAWRYQ